MPVGWTPAERPADSVRRYGDGAMRGTTLRVWVVEDRRGGEAGPLRALLRQLAGRSAGEVVLLGAHPAGPDCPAVLRSAAPEVLVLDEAGWPEAAWTEEALNLGAGIVVVTSVARSPRFRAPAG